MQHLQQIPKDAKAFNQITKQLESKSHHFGEPKQKRTKSRQHANLALATRPATMAVRGKLLGRQQSTVTRVSKDKIKFYDFYRDPLLGSKLCYRDPLFLQNYIRDSLGDQ